MITIKSGVAIWSGADDNGNHTEATFKLDDIVFVAPLSTYNGNGYGIAVSFYNAAAVELRTKPQEESNTYKTLLKAILKQEEA